MDLHHRVDEHIRTEFKYGNSDCCLFAADILKEIHGQDLMMGLREYSDRKGAALLLREKGHGTLLKALENTLQKYGWREINIDDARHGDLGLWDGRIPAVFLGHFWVMRSHRGVMFHSDNIKKVYSCRKQYSPPQDSRQYNHSS